jgi:hypothetical protein
LFTTFGKIKINKKRFSKLFSFRFSFPFPSHIFFLSIDNSWAKYTILYTTHRSTPTGSLFSRPSVLGWWGNRMKTKGKAQKEWKCCSSRIRKPPPVLFSFLWYFCAGKTPRQKVLKWIPDA